MSVKRVVIAFALVLAVVATGGGGVATAAGSDAGTDQCTTPDSDADTVSASTPDADIDPMCFSGCVTYCPP